MCYENYQKQYDLHLNTPKRAKKYSDLDIRIEKTLADLLDNRVSLYDTLKKLMYIIKLN